MRNDIDKRPKRPGDLAAILANGPGPDSEFLQGVVLTMNLVTGSNSVELAGGLVQTNCVVVGDPRETPAGTPVLIVRARRRYFILGPITAYPAVPSAITRMATTTKTTNSSAVTTTETSVDEVTAHVISGKVYRITWQMQWHAGTVNDWFYARVRLGSGITGTILTYHELIMLNTTVSYPLHAEAEWTASSTGNQTFSATLLRGGGSGSISAQGSATRPRLLYVDFIR
jgi:hypothetical protein